MIVLSSHSNFRSTGSRDYFQAKQIGKSQYPPYGPQVSQSLSVAHKPLQCWSSLSMGMAEIDDVKAATMARTIAEEKRIVSEDMIWDQIWYFWRKSQGDGLLLCVEYSSLNSLHMSLSLPKDRYLRCQQIASECLWVIMELLNIRTSKQLLNRNKAPKISENAARTFPPTYWISWSLSNG